MDEINKSTKICNDQFELESVNSNANDDEVELALETDFLNPNGEKNATVENLRTQNFEGVKCLKQLKNRLKFNFTETKNNRIKIMVQSKTVGDKKEASNRKVDTKENITGEQQLNSIRISAPNEVPKAVLSRLPLFKLWLVLTMTLGFSIVLLVASHLTHSLTLRIEAYHAIYNVMALTGCLLTIKICQRPMSIKNTFGWARVELLSCLITILFIAALCFSIFLESIQTAAHAGHQDPMHHPLIVIGLGGVGLLLNAVVFALVGGYTHHQGCFLERRASGVWVQQTLSNDAAQSGRRMLHSSSEDQEKVQNEHRKTHEGSKGVLRDVGGHLSVMLCGAAVYWDRDELYASYIDPAFAMLSVTILLYLSFPYGRECAEILLQTIPGNIDVQSLRSTLLQRFPEVINVHHLHIWSFTPEKVVATAHIVYLNTTVYRQSIDNVKKFLLDKDITQMTLQPEFVDHTNTFAFNDCLMKCVDDVCDEKQCCSQCNDVSQFTAPTPENLLASLRIRGSALALSTSNLKYTYENFSKKSRVSESSEALSQAKDRKTRHRTQSSGETLTEDTNERKKEQILDKIKKCRSESDLKITINENN